MAVNVRNISGEVDNHWRSTIPGYHFNGDRDLAKQYKGYAKSLVAQYEQTLSAGGQNSGRRRSPLPPNPVDGKEYRGFISIMVFPDGTTGCYVYAVREVREPTKRKKPYDIPDIVSGYLMIFRNNPCWRDPLYEGVIPHNTRNITPDEVSSNKNRESRYAYQSAGEANRFGTLVDHRAFLPVIRRSIDEEMTYQSTGFGWTMHRYVKASMYSGFARKVIQLILGIGDIPRIPYTPLPCSTWENEETRNSAHGDWIKRLDKAHQDVRADKTKEFDIDSAVKQEGLIQLTGEMYSGVPESALLDYLMTEGEGTWFRKIRSIHGTGGHERNGPPYITWNYEWADTDGILFDSDKKPWHCKVKPGVGIFAVPLEIDLRWNSKVVLDWIKDQRLNSLWLDWQEFWEKIARIMEEGGIDSLGGMPVCERFPPITKTWLQSGYMIQIATPEEMGRNVALSQGYTHAIGWCFNKDGNAIINTGFRETGKEWFNGYYWMYKVQISTRLREPSAISRKLDLSSEKDPWERRALQTKLQYMRDSDFAMIVAEEDSDSKVRLLRMIKNDPISGVLFIKEEEGCHIQHPSTVLKGPEYRSWVGLNFYGGFFKPTEPEPIPDGDSLGEGGVFLFVYYTDDNDTKGIRYVYDGERGPNIVEVTEEKSACTVAPNIKTTVTRASSGRGTRYTDTLGKNAEPPDDDIVAYSRSVTQLTPKNYQHIPESTFEGKPVDWHTAVRKRVPEGEFVDFALTWGRTSDYSGIGGLYAHRISQRSNIIDSASGIQNFLRYVIPTYERCCFYRMSAIGTENYTHTETINYATAAVAPWWYTYKLQTIPTGYDRVMNLHGTTWTVPSGSYESNETRITVIRNIKDGYPYDPDNTPDLLETPCDGYYGPHGVIHSLHQEIDTNWVSGLNVPKGGVIDPDFAFNWWGWARQINPYSIAADVDWTITKNLTIKVHYSGPDGVAEKISEEVIEVAPMSFYEDHIDGWLEPPVDFNSGSWLPTFQIMSATNSAFTKNRAYNIRIDSFDYKIQTSFIGHDGKIGNRALTTASCPSFIGLA